MTSIFTKILNREIPAEIIYEDEFTFVIPDKFPSMPGQLLVISKRPVPYIFDLPEAEYQALMTTTKRVAKALDQAYNTIRTCVVIEGFEVPHVHVRLYPCRDEKLITNSPKEASAEELVRVAAAIRNSLI